MNNVDKEDLKVNQNELLKQKPSKSTETVEVAFKTFQTKKTEKVFKLKLSKK